MFGSFFVVYAVRRLPRSKSIDRFRHYEKWWVAVVVVPWGESSLLKSFYSSEKKPPPPWSPLPPPHHPSVTDYFRVKTRPTPIEKTRLLHSCQFWRERPRKTYAKNDMKHLWQNHATNGTYIYVTLTLILYVYNIFLQNKYTSLIIINKNVV